MNSHLKARGSKTVRGELFTQMFLNFDQISRLKNTRYLAFSKT
jgi:hypothetical protein